MNVATAPAQPFKLAWHGDPPAEYNITEDSGFRYDLPEYLHTFRIVFAGPFWKSENDEPRYIKVTLAKDDETPLYIRNFYARQDFELSEIMFDDCVSRGLYWIMVELNESSPA